MLTQILNLLKISINLCSRIKMTTLGVLLFINIPMLTFACGSFVDTDGKTKSSCIVFLSHDTYRGDVITHNNGSYYTTCMWEAKTYFSNDPIISRNQIYLNVLSYNTPTAGRIGTMFYRKDGVTPLGYASGAFLSRSLVNSVIDTNPSSPVTVWTGFKQGIIDDPDPSTQTVMNNTTSCADWTSASSSLSTYYGYADASGSGWDDGGMAKCSEYKHILCAAQ